MPWHTALYPIFLASVLDLFFVLVVLDSAVRALGLVLDLGLRDCVPAPRCGVDSEEHGLDEVEVGHGYAVRL